MIEREHKPIVNALSKMLAEGSINWMRNLLLVFLADQLTVRTSSGLIPYYISCGNKPILPIELELPTWKILLWEDVYITDNFLAMRAHQLQHKDKNLQEAIYHLQRMWQEKKEQHDKKHGIWQKESAMDSMILLYNNRRTKDMSQKLAFKWLSPY